MVTTSSILMEEYYIACCNDKLNRVKKCVEQGVDINGECNGMSPFRIACRHGRREIVEFLINNGANVAIFNKYRNTGLTYASKYGSLKIAELLLEQNSSLNFIRQQDYWKDWTALMYAAKKGHEDIVRLLLFYDPSEEHILIEDKNGKTAIDLAKTEKIRELLKSPPIVNTKRAKAQT